MEINTSLFGIFLNFLIPGKASQDAIHSIQPHRKSVIQTDAESEDNSLHSWRIRPDIFTLYPYLLRYYFI